VSKAVLAKFGHQTNQKVKRRSDAPHFSAEWKIPEAAAVEILEDYIILWMDRRHVCENNMEKRMKGQDRGIMAHGAKRACSFSISLGSVPLASNKPATPKCNKCNTI
jgi:hypothetical protein